jgi:hypothetical protein
MVLRDSGAGFEVMLQSNDGLLPDTFLYGPGAQLLGGSLAVGDECGFRESGAGWERTGEGALSTTDSSFSSFGIAKAGSTILACGSAGRILQWDGTRASWKLWGFAPVSADLLGIAADTAGTFWLVGRAGVVLRLPAPYTAASSLQTPVSDDLYAVTSLDAARGWAVGARGTILRYTVIGTGGSVSWTIESQGTFPNLYAVFLASASAVLSGRLFAVGAQGAIVTSNTTGSPWTMMPSPTTAELRGVGGGASCGVFAVGDNGTILQLQTSPILSWLAIPSGTTANLTAIGGGGGTDRNALTVIVGLNGTVLLTSDCRKFAPRAAAGTGVSMCALRAVYTGDSCPFYISEVAGAAADGISPALRLNPDQYHSSQYRVYCGGGGRLDFRGNYGAIAFQIRTVSAPANARPTFSVSSYFGASATVPVAAYANGGLVDGSWRDVTVPLSVLSASGYDLGSVENINFGNISSGNYFVANIVLRRVSNASATSQSPVRTALRAIAVSTDGVTALACGDSAALLRLSRGSAGWTWMAEVAPVTANLTGIALLDSGDALAVGLGGTVLHRSAVTGLWRFADTTQLPASTINLRAVTNAGPSAVWVVGDGPSALYYDGSVWTNRSGVAAAAAAAGEAAQVALLAVDVLKSTSADGSVGVGFAVGYPALILRFDGGAGVGAGWSRESGPRAGSRLTGVAIRGPADAWVVGSDGSVLRWDGTAWSYVSAVTGGSLGKLAASHIGGDLLATGADSMGRPALWVLGAAAPSAITSPSTVSSLPGATVNAAATAGTCLAYASEENAAGPDGKSAPAIRLMGDTWHAPAYILYCGGAGRRNVCPYETLEFSVRIDPIAALQGARACSRPTVQLSTWNLVGPTVPIGEYLDPPSVGGCVDGVWRRVRVPLRDLGAGDATGLYLIDRVNFGNLSVGCAPVAGSGVRPRPACEDILLMNLTLVLPSASVVSAGGGICATAVAQMTGLPRNVTQKSLFGGRTLRGVTRPVSEGCGVPRPMFHNFCVQVT